jgi:hypothetical protein
MELHEQRKEISWFVKTAIDLLCALDHLSSAVCGSELRRFGKTATLSDLVRMFLQRSVQPL